MAEPTQMIIVSISTIHNLNGISQAGQTWKAILDLIRRTPGFKRLYWGRQVEDPERVQLHVVRGLLSHHHAFLSSPTYIEFTNLLSKVSYAPPGLTIRHALISTFSPQCMSLGLGAPVTGTVIYLSTTLAWDMAWANWVSIVQNVPGFMGIAGGPVLEAVDGHERAFIALVGWESVEVHEAYHRTKHFLERRGILLDPAEGGYAYFGHIAFQEEGDGEGKEIGGDSKL
ncbi:uncharacterized protein PAC_03973 [Phialocephala subalpina]|uniref:ABM domain-containing protein n=1 Tax=Phialocephala subalpina TaxID=576137 RepID=A0A1L7WMV1_9HELO|nr:uncharacterized protein PAC_03973 [Phialocephala subalpina]